MSSLGIKDKKPGISSGLNSNIKNYYNSEVLLKFRVSRSLAISFFILRYSILNYLYSYVTLYDSAYPSSSIVTTEVVTG